ncbi:lamin tail domain-containing protein [Haloarcula pelagica]|uniref:lamin tail domain-containing protein n=1 Tax=Haloarcula pelagica TaxID=3033389 RepID=UPI0024C248D6|nr:lamin tail domain-containing protein [Halomicroarcula sp. YJ-61-S]
MPGSPRSILAIFLVTLLVLAGCVSGGPIESPTQSPVEETTTAGATQTAAEGTVEVHFINVGQSVSTLVIGPSGETMLVDTGHFTDDGEYVLQYLQAHGIERLDHLVVSHNDADHIGGNAGIIDYYETEADGIGAIYDPGIAASTQTYSEYLDAVEEHGVTLYETREGDQIQMEGVDVAVLGPPQPYLENAARNENSIVLKLTHGETSFLLTGDAEDDQEAYLVDTYGEQLQATVLKAGHHGSASSTSGSLLDTVQPQAVIISSAYESQYGHPAEAVLERLADRSIPAYWTATHGNIVLVSDGSSVAVRTQQSATTDPTALREGTAIAPGTSGDVVEQDRYGGQAGASPATVADTDGNSNALEIVSITADPAGDDRRNLTGETVTFRNGGDEPLDLSGWTVADAAGRTYTFPEGYKLASGATVTLHTGSGTDTATDLYWGSGSPIWNNGGDTVIVRNSDNDTVLTEQYE